MIYFTGYIIFFIFLEKTVILNPNKSPGDNTWLNGDDFCSSEKFGSISNLINICVRKLFFIQNVLDISELIKICP